MAGLKAESYRLGFRYLLDTNVLSEPVRKRPDPKVMSRLQTLSEQSATCATVWHELRFGCQRLPLSRKRSGLEDYLQSLERSQLPILPYDRCAADIHARFRAELETQGLGASHADGEIAAIALSNDLILVTANTRHFEVFPGLEVEDWSS